MASFIQDVDSFVSKRTPDRNFFKGVSGRNFKSGRGDGCFSWSIGIEQTNGLQGWVVQAPGCLRLQAISTNRDESKVMRWNAVGMCSPFLRDKMPVVRGQVHYRQP